VAGQGLSLGFPFGTPSFAERARARNRGSLSRHRASLLTERGHVTPTPPIAEFILHGGPIYTLDPAQPEVEALAIADGKIVGAGSRAAALALGDARTRVVDLAGRTMMPGIIDGHIHVFWGAVGRLYQISLQTSDSFEAVLDKVGRAAARPDAREWIVAGPFGGAAEAEMRDEAAIARLDAASNGHPVMLVHISGHARFGNSLALVRAGISAADADPPNGEIVRDARTGRLTGLLVEAACQPLRRAVAPLTREEAVRAAKEGVALLNSLGVTGFLDATASAEMLDAFNALDARGELSAWAGFCLPASANNDGPGWSDDDIARARASCGRHVSAEFAKIYLDGVASLRTAAMIEPYKPVNAGGPEERGELLLSPEELSDRIAALDRLGMSVKVHAIGDRASRAVVDAVARVRALNGAHGPAHHLAHGNFIRREEIEQLAELNIVADLSPPLWFPSATNVAQQKAVGQERFSQAWPIRDIVETGALAAAGTDWPAVAELPNPWVSLAGMVTRRDPSGRFPGSQRPEQALDIGRALALYTRNPARVARLEAKTGMLSVGLSADLVILDRDVTRIEPDDIAGTRVLATLFEGRVVYGAL